MLLLACVTDAAGPVGPFEPTAPIGSADSDSGKCTQQKGVVYLSTYLSGWQLNEQGFDAPMGAVYYQGPKLTRPSVDGVRGEWCSSNNAAASGIPSMATGVIAWGTPSSNEPTATIYYDVNLMTSRSEFIGCGCRVKVYIRARPTWATIASTSSTVKNQNDVTIDGTCRSECSSLKVHKTQNWCSNPTNSADCSKGTFGANAFVYFEGMDASADAASIGAEGFANSTHTAAGPSSSPAATEESDGAPSAPTSSASKATPLPLLISMLALFGVVGNKRVLFLGILLASVVGAQAGGPPSWRESLGAALGQVLSSYYDSLGRCTAYMSEVMISTAIDGKKLKFYFNPSPVGDEKYVGPKLELIGSRTYFAYGDYCDASAPSVIPPEGFGTVIIGDSYWGLASAEVSLYYKVFKPDGSPSNCVLKLYMNDQSSGLERTPSYSLTKDNDCSDVPTLKINQLKVGCGTRGRNGGCLSDPKTSVNYYSTGFNVYFDGQAKSQPAALIDTSNVTTAQVPAASENSSVGNETAAPAPSAAAKPLHFALASVAVVVLSVMMI